MEEKLPREKVLTKEEVLIKEELLGVLNRYLSNPKNPMLLEAVKTTLRDLTADEAKRAALVTFMREEKWLVKLSKVRKDERIKPILDAFAALNKADEFHIPRATATPNVVPFYVHPKKRADLTLEDLLVCPEALAKDDVYSDHKPQRIRCITEGGQTLDLITYNLAQTNMLMLNNSQNLENPINKAEILHERNQRIIEMLVHQAKLGIPVFLLQEIRKADENFVSTLKEKLGQQWEVRFSDDDVATFWNKDKIKYQGDGVNSDSAVSLDFLYGNEPITITNVYLTHESKAKEGEQAVHEFFEDKRPNHFVGGDFNRRLPPLDDGFHHNGTNSNNRGGFEAYDCTDGGFTYKNNKKVRLDSEPIDEETGEVVKRREVGVAEALESEDTYQQCIFLDNYPLDGFKEKINGLNLGGATMSLEKNIYNVSRVRIESMHNLREGLDKKFPYLCSSYDENKQVLVYEIYTSPYVMQAKLIEEFKKNPTNIEPLLKATDEIMNSVSSVSLKNKALYDFGAATKEYIDTHALRSTRFKTASVVAGFAAVGLAVLASLLFPPLIAVAAAVSILIVSGLGSKGVSESNKVRKISEKIPEYRQLIDKQEKSTEEQFASSQQTQMNEALGDQVGTSQAKVCRDPTLMEGGRAMDQREQYEESKLDTDEDPESKFHM